LRRCSSPIEKLIIYDNSVEIFQPVEMTLESFKKSGWMCHPAHKIASQDRDKMFQELKDWWIKNSMLYDRK
jgi:hypothetical protein